MRSRVLYVLLVASWSNAVFAASDPAAGSPGAVEALADALTAAPAAERESLLGSDASLRTPELARALGARADALRVKGEFGRALDLFQFALDLSTRIGDLPGQAAALRGQGIVHTVRGDLTLGEETFRRSLAVAESAGDQAAIARVLSNLGVVLNQQGDYAAIELHQRSLAMLEELGDSRMLAGPLGNLALVSHQVGNSEEALEYAQRGIIGLTWAFFVAGCPATVASQRKVESASTTELMLEFHRRLAAGEGKARAPQQASLKLSRSPRYKLPFYWAGFVVMGDPR